MSARTSGNDVHSVSKYINAVDKFRKDIDVKSKPTTRGKPDQLLFFRGHANSDWECLPGIARGHFGENAIYKAKSKSKPSNEAEWVLFSRFRDMSVALEPPGIASVDPVEADWRRLVLAQHHRLPTRLLDWTMNSLVALYFAVREYDPNSPPTTDSAVAVISKPRAEVISVRTVAKHNPDPPCYVYKKDNLEHFGLFWAPHVHPRMTSQASVFTIRNNPRSAIKPEREFVVPKAARAAILQELYGLGVYEASLFPDLEGISSSLKAESMTWGSDFGVA